MRINKDIEYALIALAFLKEGALFSASVIAEKTFIPYKLLCKILQKLKDRDMIASLPGSRGGYQLKKSLDTITLQDVVMAVHDETDIISCNTSGGCTIPNQCLISPGMKSLQGVWDKVLGAITVQTFISQNKLAPDDLFRHAFIQENAL